VATLVFFHAHPDDEAIATGGTMARAAAAGHDVVLVVATRGEQGEPVAGVLRPGEPLWERRVAETHRSAGLLGVSRVEFLGYEDSGMMGEPANDNPACFWRADVSEATDRLSALLDEVGADVLTVYDANGGYGHPDHIQVHRVGHRAAAAVGVGGLFEATMNRTHITELMSQQAELLASEDAVGAEATASERVSDPDFGSEESVITHAVDVSGVLEIKRAALMAHASQIADDSFFLTMPPEAFAAAFGTEWYIDPGSARHPGAPFVTDLLANIAPAAQEAPAAGASGGMGYESR
jgi:LmbE family N-acetylglucosaminyl deacetylase